MQRFFPRLSLSGLKRSRISLAFATILITIAVVVGMTWLRSTHAASARNDLGRMQGRWVATMEDTAVVMTVEGNTMSLMPVLKASLVEKVLMTLSGSMNTQPERGTFLLDPALSPKAIDFIGPKGKIRPGIYELDGATLKLCLGTSPGTAPRPESFSDFAKSYSSFVFRRADR